MSSRLSSLLVRDGLVGVKRMEKAFQRQVIYGGSLDTILLEMNLIPEDRLVQYLALASGLPPAARDEGEEIEHAAVELIPRELAEQYRAVPVAVEGDAVRVLVCAPLEIGELEDLADRLDRGLQPLITPEYRWHLVFATAYGVDPPARYTTLARTLDVDPITPPVGRARSVIVDERAHRARGSTGSPVQDPAASADPALEEETEEEGDTEVEAALTARMVPVMPEADTQRMAAAEAGPGRAEEHARARRPTMVGVAPNRAKTEPTIAVPPSPAPDRTQTAPMLAAPGRTPPLDDAITEVLLPRRELPPRAPKRKPQPVPRVPTARIITAGRDSPLPIVRAREMLAAAEDRDTVFLTLLRAARSRARWAGLLTVQGGAVIGRVALADAGLDTGAVTTVLIPLDVVSAFRNVVSNHQSHIGPLVSGDAAIDAMVMRLGGTMPPSALILPVVLRDRVVAVVVAHRVQSDIRLADVAELLPMATAASDALGRLIVKHKTTGHRTPSDSGVIEVEVEQVQTQRLARPDLPAIGLEDWAEPPTTPHAPAFELGTELSIDAEPPVSIEALLSAIEAAKEGRAGDALAEAVARAPEAVAALMQRFPGRLRVDRFAVTGRALRAAQYGGLLELVIRLGAAATDLLIEKLGSPQRDVRFYATVCAVELRPRTAVVALSERLFDQDYGVRASAIEALAGYPPADLGEALARVRRAVHSTDPEIVGAATSAIIELGDIEAITDLIGAVERADRAGEHARRALVTLTAQDFGASERRWRKWWEGARNRHRIEWLIEGLGHKDDPIREAAIDDLRRLTGEYFGYHHDLPRKERDAAADRWAAWWRETGQRRFASTPTESERHRPTAKLPPIRD